MHGTSHHSGLAASCAANRRRLCPSQLEQKPRCVRARGPGPGHGGTSACMPRKSSGCLQCQGTCQGILNTTAREEHQTWTADATHQNSRHSHRTGRFWMRPMTTTSNGCRTLRSNSTAGRVRIVCPKLFTLKKSADRLARDACPRFAQAFKGIACVFCTETRRVTEREGSTGPLPLMPGAPRPQACVWLSRAGRLTRADPTQRLASGRAETYQVVHVSHQMPWAASGELQKAAEGQVSGHLNRRKAKRFRGQVHLGTCRQTSLTHKHLISSNHGNGSLQRHTVEPAKAATVCQLVPARRHHKKRSWTGAQVTQYWRFILR